MNFSELWRLERGFFSIVNNNRNIINKPVNVSPRRPTSFRVDESGCIGFCRPGNHGQKETAGVLNRKLKASLIIFAGRQPLFVDPNGNLGGFQATHKIGDSLTVILRTTYEYRPAWHLIWH